MLAYTSSDEQLFSWTHNLINMRGVMDGIGNQGSAPELMDFRGDPKATIFLN